MHIGYPALKAYQELSVSVQQKVCSPLFNIWFLFHWQAWNRQTDRRGEMRNLFYCRGERWDNKIQINRTGTVGSFINVSEARRCSHANRRR